MCSSAVASFAVPDACYGWE